MSVVFAKAPLRLSLGGGGTDLPSYYREHGGFLVAGAIDQYVYLLTHTVFQRRYRLKYSAFEEVDDPAEIRHPILRETLTRHWRGSPLEIAAIADIPAGTGLGSSGTFTVCLLKSLAVAGHQPTTPAAIAEAACHIEIDVLGEPVGKQDQYVAAHGGICAYTFHPDDTVSVEPLRLDAPAIERMADHFLLFYTGETRSAGELLGDQDRRTRALDPEMLENLHRTKEMGLLSRDLLERGELDAYARLMHEHWLNKKSRSAGMSSARADHLYDVARRHGAVRREARGCGRRGVPARVLGGRRANAPRPRVGGVGRGALRLRLPGLCRIRAAVSESPERPLRVGVVGCGLIGGKRAAALGRDQVIGCFDIDPAQSAAFAERTGALAVARLDDLLSAGLDVVIVATTHDALAATSVRALASGAHVLVEKPGALTPRQIDEVAHAAAAAGRLVKVGFNHRFHPAIARAVAELRGGDHGDLMYLRARYGHGGRVGYEREWRARPELSGGGELIDQGMHLLDLSYWLLGDLPLHSALVRTNYWDMAVDDNAVLTLADADRQGPWASFHVSCSEWKNEFALDLYTRRSKLAVSGLAGSYGAQCLRIYRMRPEMGPPDLEELSYPPEDVSWREEWAHLRAAIARGADAGPLLGDLASARYALERVGEAYRSAGYEGVTGTPDFARDVS